MKKNVGTAKELDLKPGDSVRFVGRGDTDAGTMIVESVYVIPEGAPFPGQVRMCLSNYGWGIFADEQFRIISRADNTPKLWRDMSDEEKGELLLAHHDGKVIEINVSSDGIFVAATPLWFDHIAYRVRPERETVTLNSWGTCKQWLRDGDLSLIHDSQGKYRITYDLIDGKPDCEKCPTCGTAKSVDMEEL